MTVENWLQALAIVSIPLCAFALVRVIPRGTATETVYWFRCHVCGARWSVEDPMFIQAVKTHGCEEVQP
jgi:hypothetical protein